MNDIAGGGSLDRASSLAATPLGRIETVSGGGAETRLIPSPLDADSTRGIPKAAMI